MEKANSKQWTRHLPPDKKLFTPGPLGCSLATKQAMLRDLGSRDSDFIKVFSVWYPFSVFSVWYPFSVSPFDVNDQQNFSVDGGRDPHLLVGSGWGLKSRVERRFAPGTFASLVKVNVPKLAQTKLCSMDFIRGAAHTLWRQCFRHRAQEREPEFSS